VSGVNEDFYWKFLPSPHTQGRDLGFIKVHVDYLVPIGTDYYTDMQYLFDMGNALHVDFFYYADQTGTLATNRKGHMQHIRPNEMPNSLSINLSSL
jgi:hypothetical protein